MGENSQIEWTDHTFNPWMGCTKISPGCDHCYAEVLSRRFGHAKWGNHPRNRTSQANWKKPIVWNGRAMEFKQERGRRQRVFCASMADVFDNQVPADWRLDLFALNSRVSETRLAGADKAAAKHSENATQGLGRWLPQRLAGHNGGRSRAVRSTMETIEDGSGFYKIHFI